jgi:DNA mismatch repair ATPase MutS
MLLSTQFAFAIEGWRAPHGPAAARWMTALGELEALVSLATFAFEHPQLPFPEIVVASNGPLFEGRALAHPLLPPATRVANDARLDSGHRLLLVTGSNMSGKSTYLRTIGANAVLALAGAPVVAEQLRLSPLAIGASLRISDSLQAGVSRFFAEIKRLRTVVDLCEASPMTLFLLDEILHGTNSDDRLAGAGSLVKRLVERGAVGLCTTHDLALARIVDEIGPAAANVHFEDVISDGQIRFDYRVKPGVVTRGNALALMKLVGLPV